jgi:hypothetical protein
MVISTSIRQEKKSNALDAYLSGIDIISDIAYLENQN